VVQKTSPRLGITISMKLFIDTHERDKIIVGIESRMYETDAREEKSQRLLPFIDEMLKKEGLTLKDITEIQVHTGPGSFTGLRVGVATANALGWTLGITVNGKNLRLGEMADINYAV